MRLEGKSAFITGGSRGIGAAIALLFSREGCDVAITYHTNKKAADDVKKEIESLGRKCIALKCDVKSKNDVENAVRSAVSAFGKIDILVNNAGILIRGTLPDINEKSFDETVNTNLRGVFYCTRSVAPYMIKRKYGRIVNISSVAALSRHSSSSVYAATKAGVAAFTRVWSQELGQHKITVNAIAPGPVKTDMMQKASSDLMKKYLSNIPLGRLAEPEDIARAALFLASEDSSYITGQVLVVSGGSI